MPFSRSSIDFHSLTLSARFSFPLRDFPAFFPFFPPSSSLLMYTNEEKSIKISSLASSTCSIYKCSYFHAIPLRACRSHSLLFLAQARLVVFLPFPESSKSSSAGRTALCYVENGRHNEDSQNGVEWAVVFGFGCEKQQKTLNFLLSFSFAHPHSSVLLALPSPPLYQCSSVAQPPPFFLDSFHEFISYF